MGFFKGHQGRRSYDLLSSYNHFVPGYKDLVGVVVFLIIGTILGSVITLTFSASGLIPLKYGILISYPMMFLPAMIFASNVSRRNEVFEDGYAIDNSNFGKHRWYTMTFVAFMMSIATAFIIEPISMLLPEMPDDLAEQMAELLNGPAWVTFISVSIFAPFFEEWLCRGIVLRGLLKKVGATWAIIISAAFFALIHMNLWQAVPAFLMGLVFGYMYYKTGSLKLVMLMHFANNTMAFAISQIPALQNAEYFKDILSPWAYAGVYVLAVVILISGLIILRGIPQKDDNLGGCRLIKSLL